jgi:hypothetical protein
MGKRTSERAWFNFPIRASDAEAVKAAAEANQQSAASLIRKIVSDWVAANRATEVPPNVAAS